MIDIKLKVEGPQGCGKSSFIEKILPAIAAAAEAHFVGMESDILVTASSKQHFVAHAPDDFCGKKK